MTDTDYLERWTQDLLSQPFSRLPRAVEVEGVQRGRIAAGPQYAKIRVRAAPADAFSVDVELPPRVAVGLHPSYLEHAVFGMLDVLATEQRSPVFGVRIVIVHVEHDRVGVSPMAFRLAGRDAAQRMLVTAEMQRNSYRDGRHGAVGTRLRWLLLLAVAACLLGFAVCTGMAGVRAL